MPDTTRSIRHAMVWLMAMLLVAVVILFIQIAQTRTTARQNREVLCASVIGNIENTATNDRILFLCAAVGVEPAK